MNKQITCTVCPIGCKIIVTKEAKKIEIKEGNRCKRGIEFAYSEALDPKRMLTSTILVNNGKWPLVSVKTSKSVPKDKVFEVLEEIKKTKVNAPIKIGQVLIENILDLNIDVVATKSID